MSKIATIAALISGGLFFYLAATIWFLSLGFRRHWGWGASIFLFGPVGMVFYYLTHLRSALGCTLVMLLGATMFTCGGIFAYETFPASDQLYALAHGDTIRREMPKLVESLAMEAHELELAAKEAKEKEPSFEKVEEPPKKDFYNEAADVDPESLVGLGVHDVRLKLGKPMGQMSLGIGFVLVYPGMELTSRDGKTISYAQRVAK